MLLGNVNVAYDILFKRTHVIWNINWRCLRAISSYFFNKKGENVTWYKLNPKDNGKVSILDHI